MANAKRTAMMLLGADEQGRWLRVALATTHVPIKLVSETSDPGKNPTRHRIGRAGLP